MTTSSLVAQKKAAETVPSIHYIGRQLGFYFIDRQVYGEIIYLSDKNLSCDI